MSRAVKNSKIRHDQKNGHKRNTAVRRKRNTHVVDPFCGSGVTLLRQEMPRNRKVDITPLIRFAAELPNGPLKMVLLSEVDGQMDVSTFLSLYPRWLRLARIKSK